MISLYFCFQALLLLLSKAPTAHATPRQHLARRLVAQQEADDHRHCAWNGWVGRAGEVGKKKRDEQKEVGERRAERSALCVRCQAGQLVTTPAEGASFASSARPALYPPPPTD